MQAPCWLNGDHRQFSAQSLTWPDVRATLKNVKFIIPIAIFFVIGVVAFIISIPFEKERKRRLQRYWDRICTGREWRRRFPNTPQKEIRQFLQAFVEGFAFKDKDRLRFSPDDKIMDVYRALYPSKGGADSLEIETFAMLLKEEYRFDLALVHDPDVTLGKLFELILRSAQKMSNGAVWPK